jgi:hypothetical protein
MSVQFNKTSCIFFNLNKLVSEFLNKSQCLLLVAVPQPKPSMSMPRDSIASTNMSHRRMSKKRSRKEPITYYELLELERQKNEAQMVKVKVKRNFPLAPDGFIPNSVVKKFFELLDAPPESQRKVWKLKWVNIFFYESFSNIYLLF